jgi:hypothetical protein
MKVEAATFEHISAPPPWRRVRVRIEKQMADVLTYGVLLIAIIGVAVLIYPTAIRVLNSERRKGSPSQNVVARKGAWNRSLSAAVAVFQRSARK